MIQWIGYMSIIRKNRSLTLLAVSLVIVQKVQEGITLTCERRENLMHRHLMYPQSPTDTVAVLDIGVVADVMEACYNRHR